MTEQGLPAAATKYYTHDAWNRLTEVKIGTTSLGQYEYNALHWRTVKRSLSPGSGSIDEMRLMYYSANWQLRWHGRPAREPLSLSRSWTSGFTEDERAQTFWGKRYIDDAVGRRRDRNVDGTYDNNFFYVTDAQFSTVAMVNAGNSRVVERVTYNSYGKARHHFGGDVTGDGAATAAGDDAALVATIGLGSNSIGQANYKAEQDLNRDGTISNADRTTLAALTGGADQAALASALVSFTTTGSGGSIVHGPDNPIAWDGYVFGSETLQYTVRFRWYDPVLGRWLERDPIGYWDGMSQYCYVTSAPVVWTDPFGLWCRRGCKVYVDSKDDTLWGLATMLLGDGSKWETLGFEGDPQALQMGAEVNLCALVATWADSVDRYASLMEKSLKAGHRAHELYSIAFSMGGLRSIVPGLLDFAGSSSGAVGVGAGLRSVQVVFKSGIRDALGSFANLLQAAGVGIAVYQGADALNEGRYGDAAGAASTVGLGLLSWQLSAERGLGARLIPAAAESLATKANIVAVVGSAAISVYEGNERRRLGQAQIDQIVDNADFLSQQATLYFDHAQAIRGDAMSGLGRIGALNNIPNCPCKNKDKEGGKEPAN